MPSTTGKLLLVIPLLLAAVFYWVILRPSRWLVAFFFCLLLLPPLPLPLGNSGVHVAPLFALLGGLASLVWIREWRSWSHPLTLALVIFIGVLLESLAFAAIYSGWEIAIASLARVVLIRHQRFRVSLCVCRPPAAMTGTLSASLKFLFGLAVAAALFACVDFYFQFPAPAGYGDQFVYLQEGVFRRAQGLFYEASTLGNFCAFFLVMIMVCLFRRREETPLSRAALQSGGLILAVALLFSYSRASVLNVVVAAAVLACLHAGRVRRSLDRVAGRAGRSRRRHPACCAQAVCQLLGPALGILQFFRSSRRIRCSPDAWATGRFYTTSWRAIRGTPCSVVGYKTLPYSTFVGSTVIADNTYLGLLVETGVVGLAAFIGLNVVILRTGWIARRSPRPQAQFFGEWIFCFWCGEMVQMLSGDLITYWRVLPVYFWVLGTAARLTREEA